MRHIKLLGNRSLFFVPAMTISMIVLNANEKIVHANLKAKAVNFNVLIPKYFSDSLHGECIQITHMVSAMGPQLHQGGMRLSTGFLRCKNE